VPQRDFRHGRPTRAAEDDAFEQPQVSNSRCAEHRARGRNERNAQPINTIGRAAERSSMIPTPGVPAKAAPPAANDDTAGTRPRY